MSKFDKSSLEKSIFEALVNKSSLQEIFECIYASVKFQLAILNAENHLLEHVFSNQYSRFQSFLLDKGFLPSSFLNPHTRTGEKIAHVLHKGESVLFEKGELDDNIYMLKSLGNPGPSLELLFIGFNNLEQEDMALFICDSLQKLHHYYRKSKKNIGDNQLDVMDKNFSRELLLSDGDLSHNLFGFFYGRELWHQKLPFIANFSIAVLTIIDFMDKNEALTKAQIGAREAFPHTFSVTDDDYLYIFFFGLDKNSLYANDENIKKSLVSFCKKSHLYCGLSNCFDALSSRAQFKRQAMELLEEGRYQNPASIVFTSEEMYADVLITSAIRHLGRDTLLLHDLVLLQEHDLEKKTDYLHTLEIYIESQTNMSAAASRLFIDRSTIHYRLKKIEKLLMKDLENPDILKQLGLGIKIFRHVAI